MLRLQLPSGEFLISSPDSTITMELVSTLFNQQDTFAGSYSYPVKLPLEPNKRLIKNAHFITSSNSLKKIEVLAWMGIRPWKRVEFIFDIDDRIIDGYIKIDNATIQSQLKSKKLNELWNSMDNTVQRIDGYANHATFMRQTVTAPIGTYPFVFFPYKNEGAFKTIDPADYGNYPDLALPLSSYINEWKITNGYGEFVTDPSSTIKHIRSPFFFLSYIIRRVLKELKYDYEGTWLDDPNVNRIVLFSPIAIEPNSTMIVSDMTYYMPDMPLNDFFKQIRNRFNLLIEFDASRKVCLIESYDNILKSMAATDLRKMQIRGIKQVAESVGGFTVTEKPDDKDLLYKDTEGNTISNPLFVIADGEKKVEMEISTCKMLTENAPYQANTKWRIPNLKRPMFVNNVLMNDLKQVDQRYDFPLRLLYYHGMVPDQNGFLYPYGSADALDWQGKALTNYSLSYVDDSLTPNSPKRYYDFLYAGKKLEVNFCMTKEQFMRIKNGVKVLIRDKNNSTVSCLISQLTPEVSRKPMVLAKAVLYAALQENNITAGALPAAPPVDNGVVYAKIVFRNFTSASGDEDTISWEATYRDVYVQFFADAAGTTPKTVSQLTVRWKEATVATPSSYSHTNTFQAICAGTEFLLRAQGVDTYSESANPHNPPADYEPFSYHVDYSLEANAGYTII